MHASILQVFQGKNIENRKKREAFFDFKGLSLTQNLAIARYCVMPIYTMISVSFLFFLPYIAGWNHLELINSPLPFSTLHCGFLLLKSELFDMIDHLLTIILYPTIFFFLLQMNLI